MLLFRKPLTEIAVGESFKVTVTREHWDAAAKEVGRNVDAERCVLSRAFRAHLGLRSAAVGPNTVSTIDGLEWARFTHDGQRIVVAFDSRHYLPPTTWLGRTLFGIFGPSIPQAPGFPAVVTFTREA